MLFWLFVGVNASLFQIKAAKWFKDTTAHPNSQFSGPLQMKFSHEHHVTPSTVLIPQVYQLHTLPSDSIQPVLSLSLSFSLSLSLSLLLPHPLSLTLPLSFPVSPSLSRSPSLSLTLPLSFSLSPFVLPSFSFYLYLFLLTVMLDLEMWMVRSALGQNSKPSNPVWIVWMSLQISQWPAQWPKVTWDAKHTIDTEKQLPCIHWVGK